MFSAEGMNQRERDIVIVVMNESEEDELFVRVAAVISQPISVDGFSEVQYWAKPITLHRIKAKGKCAVPFSPLDFTDGPDTVDLSKGGTIQVAIENRNGSGFSEFPVKDGLRISE